MTDLAQTLSSIPFLAGLDSAELVALGRLMSERHIARGTHLFRTGDPGDTLILVRRGRLAVSLVNRQGQELKVDEVGEGAVVGEMAILTGRPRSADIVAITDCVVYTLSKHGFLSLVRRNPAIAGNMLRELALRVEQANSRLANLAFIEVYRRLAAALAERIARAAAEGRGLGVDDVPSTAELAALVGTTPEVTRKALARLEEDGFIVRQDGELRLRAPLPATST
jgi:CRP/FNR family transcriptional regulator, cyclic AMP receptor protein